MRGAQASTACPGADLAAPRQKRGPTHTFTTVGFEAGAVAKPPKHICHVGFQWEASLRNKPDSGSALPPVSASAPTA